MFQSSDFVTRPRSNSERKPSSAKMLIEKNIQESSLSIQKPVLTFCTQRVNNTLINIVRAAMDLKMLPQPAYTTKNTMFGEYVNILF